MKTAIEFLDALKSGIDVKISDPAVRQWSDHYQISEEAAEALGQCCEGPVEEASEGDIRSAALVLMKYESTVRDDGDGVEFAEAADAGRAVQIAEAFDGSVNVND